MMLIKDFIMFYVAWFVLRWIFGIKDCFYTDSREMIDIMNTQIIKSRFKGWLFSKLVMFKKTGQNEFTVYIKYFHQDIN